MPFCSLVRRYVEEVDAIMGKVKRNLRPLVRFLSLQGTSAYAGLLKTLETMVEAFELGEPLPVLRVSPGFIPTRLKRYLLEPSGAIVRDRYEFMVYRQLRDGLEAGDLHCRDSAHFRILAGENRFVRVQDGKTVWERPLRQRNRTAPDLSPLRHR